MVFNEAISAMHRVILCTLSLFFAIEFFRVLTKHGLVALFVQRRVLKKLHVGLYRLIPNIFLVSTFLYNKHILSPSHFLCPHSLK
jgi:hypothetical protein